jgi:hypothetical protein
MARLPRFDYTGRDYDSARADAVQRISTAVPDWTDFSPANPAMAIVEQLCIQLDLISYYQDRQANNAFLVTADEADAVILHTRGMGYRMATATPASTPVTFTLDKAYDSPVTINIGDRVETIDGAVGGEMQAKLELAAGATSGTVDWVEGTTIAEDLGFADGSASLALRLARAPFLWDTESIDVDGIAWTRVDDFLASNGSAQVYVVTVDAFDAATVTFGDGVNGAIPGNGASILASYRIGGGKAGNVEAGSLRKLTKAYTTASGVPVRLTVTNAAKATGGDEKETLAHAKLYAPKVAGTNGRAVARDDYATIAERVPGVARVLVQTSNDDTTIRENTVLVQVVPVGSGVPSPTLLGNVRAAIVAVALNTVRVLVVPALYVDVALVGTVYVRKGAQTVLDSALEADADAAFVALQDYFDAQNIDIQNSAYTINFGSTLPLSDFNGIIRDAGTLRKYVDLTSPVANTFIAAKVFPRLRGATKSVLSSPTRIVYTWDSVGTTLVFRMEP